MTYRPGVGYVGASGIAGYGDSNAIRTQKTRENIYIIGDNISAAVPGEGLMAPLVEVAAHHQANQILHLLLGND